MNRAEVIKESKREQRQSQRLCSEQLCHYCAIFSQHTPTSPTTVSTQWPHHLLAISHVHTQTYFHVYRHTPSGFNANFCPQTPLVNPGGLVKIPVTRGSHTQIWGDSHFVAAVIELLADAYTVYSKKAYCEGRELWGAILMSFCYLCTCLWRFSECM